MRIARLLAAAALALAACARGPGDRAPASGWFEEGRASVARAAAPRPAGTAAPGSRARNVILFIGDGMGISTVTAARILEGQRRGDPGEENQLAFEALPHVGLVKTYSTNLQVSESAATMTAMTTGVKTKGYVIGLDSRAVPGEYQSAAASRVRTLFEDAEARGLATGIVTTTRVTHATPAACYAHAPQREWEDDSKLPEPARAAGFPDLARQLVEFAEGDGIDVVMGGGRGNFLPNTQRDPERPEVFGQRRDGRDLIAEWQARHAGGVYAWNRSQLAAVDAKTTSRLLGLFEPSHLAFEADRGDDVAGEPSLTEMTAKAIEVLARHAPRGYLLMVEGGRIDQAHHLGNAYRALTETIELSNAVRAALLLTSPDDTLVVVTADHGHVFTIAGYPHRGNDILGKVVTVDEHGERAEEYLRDASGRPFTTLGYANGPGYTGRSDVQPEGPKRFPHLPTRYYGITRGRPDLTRVDTADPDYLQEATVPTRNDTHAGEDVPIYAGGPGSERFDGVREQNYVYHAITAALGWADAPAPRP